MAEGCQLRPGSPGAVGGVTGAESLRIPVPRASQRLPAEEAAGRETRWGSCKPRARLRGALPLPREADWGWSFSTRVKRSDVESIKFHKQGGLCLQIIACTFFLARRRCFFVMCRVFRTKVSSALRAGAFEVLCSLASNKTRQVAYWLQPFCSLNKELASTSILP